MSVSEILLDIAKPHTPNIIEFAKVLTEIDGVEEVKIEVVEMDIKIETAKLRIKGNNLDLNKIEEKIRKLGGIIRSIDGVTVTK